MGTSTKIPVIVCEFHQEVLQYIHRLIARKKLPFEGIKMVHFDSHPDLAYPDRLSADDCYCKEKMYYDLDIADWILPLMYAGHIDNLFWVKPPWANQIPEKRLQFSVGKEVNTGRLRVTCNEDYFLEDCTFAPLSKLTNVKDVTVESIELKTLLKRVKSEKDELLNPITTSSVAGGSLKNSFTSSVIELPANDASNCKSDSVTSTSFEKTSTVEEKLEVPSKKMKLGNGEILSNGITVSENLNHLLSNEKYILDIDLDFFSVTNPFLQDYTEEQYQELQKAYTLTFPSSRNDDNILHECVSDARLKITKLKETIDSVCTDSNLNKDEENKSFIEFLKLLKKEKKDVDWEMVHNAGMTTQLPHHVSSESEIDELIDQMVELLMCLPTPNAITVARSTVDEYCPPQYIELIEEKVLSALKSVYSKESLEIYYEYKDDSRLL